MHLSTALLPHVPFPSALLNSAVLSPTPHTPSHISYKHLFAQVKNRLQLHKQKRERDEEVAPSREAQFAEYEAKMRKMAEAEEEGKQAKKDRKKAKKEDESTTAAGNDCKWGVLGLVDCEPAC
jgi:hypothetical protein